MGNYSKTRTGSFNDNLARLEVGEYLWIETTVEEYASVQRRVTARSRFPETMQHMRFFSQGFTCISNSKVGDIRIAVRIERVA
jgi:hypothetical protein